MSGIIGVSPDMRSGVIGVWPKGHFLQIVAGDFTTGSHVAFSGVSPQQIMHSSIYIDITCKSTNPRFLLTYNSASAYADDTSGALLWAERNPSTGSANKVLFEGNGITTGKIERKYGATDSGAAQPPLTTYTKQYTASIGTVIRFELWMDGDYFWHSAFPISIFAMEIQQ